MINVRDFGAVGDGITKDTAAIQRAIDAGGMVMFPPGIYLAGTLYLRSNGGLYLENGAVLLASPDMEDYNSAGFCPQNRASKLENTSGGHFIVAVEQKNIVIAGDGRIDGNRKAFYGSDEEPDCGRNSEKFFSWQELQKIRRPGQMIYFCECSGVRIRDVQLYNAPYWTCFCHGCEDVQIRGLRILNDQRGWNTDGIDIDCCRRVTISDCIIDSGDDCITLRGWDEPLKRPVPCENITVTNCVLHTNCNGFRIGVGAGVIRNVAVSNIVFHNCQTAVALNSNYGTDPAAGVQIEDVIFSDLQIDAEKPFAVMSQVRGDTGEPAAKEIRNISFSHVRGTFSRASLITGCGGHGVGNISFQDVELRCTGSALPHDPDPAEPYGEWSQVQPEGVFYVTGAEGVVFDKVRIICGNDFPGWKYGLIEDHTAPVMVRDSDVGPILKK